MGSCASSSSHHYGKREITVGSKCTTVQVKRVVRNGRVIENRKRVTVTDTENPHNIMETEETNDLNGEPVTTELDLQELDLPGILLLVQE